MCYMAGLEKVVMSNRRLLPQGFEVVTSFATWLEEILIRFLFFVPLYCVVM